MNFSSLLKGVAVVVGLIAASFVYYPDILKTMAAWLPSKPAIAAATASNALYKPSNRPIGLFFGGTSGIGQAMAEQLARQTNGRAHIILLGRNQAAADKIIAGLTKSPDSTPPEEASKYSFIKVDATSMAQVREVTSKLTQELDKINFIVATTGFLTLKGRDETTEGIDRKLSCNFYARFRFIYDLMPLVEKAAEKGEQTGVVSVLAAGRGGEVDLNDLGLVKGYSLRNAEGHAITYTDSAFQNLAEKYRNIGFYHIFPGMVRTPMANSFPVVGLVMPLFKWATESPAECAEVMWWRVWGNDPAWKTGAHQINHRGEAVTPNKFVTPEGKKAIWDHAVKITS